ncbi:MAG: hypothetical protein K2W96_15745 [Gemmataceae bacterium]|nr:hypothetical protein [Gemmataceae bacterium]
MSERPAFTQRLKDALAASGKGLGGLFDHLVRLLVEEDGGVEFREGRCVLRLDRGGSEELPLTKGTFRMVLARAAALCEEHAPGSVSPYGGEGRLRLGEAIYRVSFTNTTGEQRLRAWREIVPEPVGARAEGLLPAVRQG